MAAAQQTLYMEKDRTRVNAKEFLEAVCSSAKQAFSTDVALHVDVDAVQLPNDVTMPLALVLNELLTNSAKHDDDAGKFDI